MRLSVYFLGKEKPVEVAVIVDVLSVSCSELSEECSSSKDEAFCSTLSELEVSSSTEELDSSCGMISVCSYPHTEHLETIEPSHVSDASVREISTMVCPVAGSTVSTFFPHRLHSFIISPSSVQVGCTSLVVVYSCLQRACGSVSMASIIITIPIMSVTAMKIASFFLLSLFRR